MHALVVRVTIDDLEAARQELLDETIPRVSQAPGFISGYWSSKDNTGMGHVVFDSEEAAEAAREQIQSQPPAQVKIQDAEIRVVEGHA